MARSSQEMSSKRQFHWTAKVSNEDHHQPPTINPSNTEEEKTKPNSHKEAEVVSPPTAAAPQRKKLQAVAVSRLRSVLNTAFGRNRSHSPRALGPRVVGTLFGTRRGHVHFALQKDPHLPPAFLVELATPITGLVREMASGLVRIALECDKPAEEEEAAAAAGKRLLEEPRWRTYCNGKKCGFAARRECGAGEWNVLKAVEPISMGAGVLPADGGDGAEVMYMRAKFERVVGSRDSEAFYMMNPDSNGAPELSIYLLRL